MEENLKKNTIWNIIGTTINAFNSLFLMIIVTRINGVFDAGIFTFAFSVATLLNIVGVYAGRIYQVTDQNEFSDKDYLINRIVSCSIMIIISFGYVFFKGYIFSKQVIILSLCFLKMLEAFSEVLYAYYQKEGNLYRVGISLTLKGLFGLIAFLITDLISGNVILSIIMFILSYLIVLNIYDLRNIDLKKIMHKRYDKKNVFRIFYKGFGVFATSFLTIYLINASKYAIDGNLSDDIQAVFGIIIMPATVMILIAQFIIHPFLNMITKEIGDNNYKELNKIIFKIFLFILLFGTIGTIMCYFIGIPILEFIYNISLSGYSLCLCLIILGATFYALTSVINTVLIALRRTVIQTVIYGVISLSVLFISNELAQKYGILGASLNYLLTMVISFVLFVIVYYFILRKERLK